jgi:hypothetical protein
MKRNLTAREWILLGLLGVIALISGYVMLFYMPMTARRDAAREETELCRLQVEAAQVRLEEKRRMERELEDLFAGEAEPVRLANYDNLQPVMLELNTVLSGTEDYSLSFGTVDTSQTIVRRSISLSFTSGSYEAARATLRQLCGSAYRCLLDSVDLSIGRESGGSVSVNGVLLFFEYQPK